MPRGAPAVGGRGRRAGTGPFLGIASFALGIVGIPRRFPGIVPSRRFRGLPRRGPGRPERQPRPGDGAAPRQRRTERLRREGRRRGETPPRPAPPPPWRGGRGAGPRYGA